MKQKLLVLTPRFPYPPIGGDRLRIYQLCKYLSADFDLSLLSMCSSKEEMSCTLVEDGIFSRVERVFHRPWQRLWGLLSVLPSKTPLQVGYYRNSEFARRLNAMAPMFDGLLAHLIRTGDYIRSYPLPKVLEMTDSISLSYSRTSKYDLNSITWRFGYRRDAQRLLRYEKELIEGFDLSVLVSGVDRDFLVPEDSSNRTLVCPNGVDTQAFPFEYSPDGTTIVFIGNTTAYHNIDAILYFLQKIFPMILHRNPQAKLKVVGRINKKLQQRLQRYPGVLVTGPVDSIPIAVRGAALGICPVRFGAGMQNKLLEYMALGIPAVTSPVGLEGLQATPGVHLLLAETPQDWVDHICWLLQSPDHGKSIASAARNLVERCYSWEALIAPLRVAIAKRLRSA